LSEAPTLSIDANAKVPFPENSTHQVLASEKHQPFKDGRYFEKITKCDVTHPKVEKFENNGTT
jgi:hypothetical protein